MSKRETGLDLIRCTAFLLVVVFHSFLYNGYYYEPQTGIVMWLWGSFRWLSVSCIGLFLMLTEYLKSERTALRDCYGGLLPVLLGYFLAAAISIPVRHFILGETHTLGWWGNAFFGFFGVRYGWYVEMYIGLTLLSPYLNRMMKGIPNTELWKLAGIMLILTALPGAIPLGILPDYWRSCYPATYYILGAIIRRMKPIFNPYLSILSALGVAAILGAGTVLSTDGPLGKALTWEFPDIWIVVIAVLLFISLYQVKTGPMLGRVMSFAAGGCYGGYLLSHLLDAWCYGVIPECRTPNAYHIAFLLVSIPIFLVSLLMGWGLNGIVPRLCALRKEVRV